MSNSGGQLKSSHKGKVSIDYAKDRFTLLDDDNNLIGFFGYGDDGRPAYKLAPVGVDVRTATPDQLIASSDFNLFKIVETGTVDFHSPNSISSSTFKNVEHDLGNNPMVFAFVSFSPTGTAFPLPYLDLELIGGDAGKVRSQISFECVNNNLITFFHRDIVGATNWTNYIRYYLIRETAAYA